MEMDIKKMNQLNNSIKETFWSRFANDFEKLNNYVAGKKEMEHLKKKLSEKRELGNVLELGCGDGVFSKTIAQNADYLVATDWSDEMIEAAKNNLGEMNSIKVQKENCFDLSFKDDNFDTVFMANLLHVIPEPEKALCECKRVLKANGRIIILSFTMHGMSFFNKIGMLYRYLKTYGKPPKQSRVLTVSNAKQMLEKEHFSIQQAELTGCKMKSVLVTAKNIK